MKIQTIANRVKRINTNTRKKNPIDQMLQAGKRYKDYIELILDGEKVEPIKKSEGADKEFLDSINKDLQRARDWQVEQLLKGSLYGQENDLQEGKKLLREPITHEVVMHYRMMGDEIEVCGQAIKQLKTKNEAGLKVEIVKLRKALIVLIAEFDRKFANSKHGKALIAAGVLT